ncbi:hypothetical protein [Natronorarus salvus]|uniref:hypothetical protein n=1 Tax=Natronorarus salvus TaxID=3117733 RepID=UPI002F25F693
MIRSCHRSDFSGRALDAARVLSLVDLGVVGLVWIFDPERSHRLWNPLQVRRVELTQTGRDLSVVGGTSLVLVGFAAIGALLSPSFAGLYAVTVLVGSAYAYRRTDDSR